MPVEPLTASPVYESRAAKMLREVFDSFHPTDDKEEDGG